MSVTKEQAMAAKYRDELYWIHTPTGKRVVARVNGKCVTSRTDPDFFRLPMKHGLYQHFSISNHNAQEWSVA